VSNKVDTNVLATAEHDVGGSWNDRRNAHKSRTRTRREQRGEERGGEGGRSGGAYLEELESFETVAGDDVDVLTAVRPVVVSQ